MLKDDLYSIESLNNENNVVEAMINLNASHKIFEGHFPQQPVLPGVCMMQMVREILETSFSKKLQLLKTNDIRFTVMVVPTQDALLKFIVQHNLNDMQQINVNTKILNKEDVVCCKMKATYKLLP